MRPGRCLRPEGQTDLHKERYGRLVNIQNMTVRVSGVGQAVRTLRAIPRVCHAKVNQYQTLGQNQVHTSGHFTFLSKCDQTKVWTSAGSYHKKQNDSKNVVHAVCSLLNFLLTLTHMHESQIHPRFRLLSFSAVCWDMSRPACHIPSQIIARKCP